MENAEKKRMDLRFRLSERQKNALVFGIFGFLIFAYFTLVPAPLGDDIWFMGQTSGIGAFVAFRYQYWSSRCLIEALLLIFCRLPLMVARVFMAGVAAVGAIALHRLFTDRSSKSALLVCSLFLLFSSFAADLHNRYFTLLAHTGFLSTTMNYLLPAVCGLVALFPLQKAANGERLRWYECIVYPLCLLIGANQEQVCAILAAAYLLFGIYFIYVKKLRPMVVVQFALAAASLVFILTCPGNANRLLDETATWNPAFADFGALQKLDVGISAALDYFFSATPLVLLFELFLAAVIFKKYENPFFRAIAAVPFAVSLAFGPLAGLTNLFYPGLADAFADADPAAGWLNLTGSPALAAPAKFVVGCLLVALLCVGIYLAFGHRVRTLVMLTVFAAGLASKAVIGFSPTLAVSGQRTAFFLLLALVALIAALFCELREAGAEKAAPRLSGLCVLLGALGYLTMCLPTLGI